MMLPLLIHFPRDLFYLSLTPVQVFYTNFNWLIILLSLGLKFLCDHLSDAFFFFFKYFFLSLVYYLISLRLPLKEKKIIILIKSRLSIASLMVHVCDVLSKMFFVYLRPFSCVVLDVA